MVTVAIAAMRIFPANYRNKQGDHARQSDVAGLNGMFTDTFVQWRRLTAVGQIVIQ
jgi:hypothetical protein